MPPPTFTAWVSVVTVGVLLRIAPLVLGWGGYLSKRSVVCVCIIKNQIYISFPFSSQPWYISKRSLEPSFN